MDREEKKILNSISKIERSICCINQEIAAIGAIGGIVDTYALLPDPTLHPLEIWYVINTTPGSIGNIWYSSGSEWISSLTLFDTRLTNLEQNVYKVTYYAIVTGASGTITPPTGATFNSDEFGNSGNSILSKININNKPILESPKTAGGLVVTANLNTTTGVWTSSGVYTDTSVALIYSINISADDYSNLNNFYIIEEVQLNSPTSLTNTYVGVGNVSNEIGGSSSLTYSNSILLNTGASISGDIGGVYTYAMGSGIGTLGFNSYGYNAGVNGYGALMQLNPSTGLFSMFLESNVLAGVAHAHTTTLEWDLTGKVRIPVGLLLGTPNTTLGNIGLYGSTSGIVTIQTAAIAGTTTLTLPDAYAASNGYLLSSTTGGVLSWISPPTSDITIGTTAITGGATTQMLFNLGGVVSSNAGLTYVAGGLFKIISTTQQFSAQYDASNRLDLTIGITGNATFALTGTAPKFTFSNFVTVTGVATATPGTSTTFTDYPFSTTCAGGTGLNILYATNGSGRLRISQSGESTTFQSAYAESKIVVGAFGGVQIGTSAATVWVNILGSIGNGAFGIKIIEQADNVSTYLQIGKTGTNSTNQVTIVAANAIINNVLDLKNITNITQFFVTTTGVTSIGNGAGTNAKLNVLSTIEQLRLQYDSTHFASFTVGSTGNLTVDLTGTTPKFQFNKYIGITIAPTALLTLGAGLTTAGGAPLKFTTQASALATPEQGTMELIGNSLQFTQKAERRGIAMTQGVIVADVSANNTVTETAALITSSHGVNYLEIGKSEEIHLYGTIEQASAGGGILSIRTKYAGTTIHTTSTITGNIPAGTPFIVKVIMTCRTTGATGTIQINSYLEIGSLAITPGTVNLVTVDTTTGQDTTVTAIWSVANANNNVTFNQGHVLCIEPNR